jgi:tRNA pseudouridine32 synthase/23S rRNA pseudouridine746 synthase
MGEFWYGQSPDGPVRTHGHFYPSCTSKCGPLLKYMLKGLKTEAASTLCGKPSVIHLDDEIIIASKPSGMPSVPGLDGSESLLEWLQGKYGTSVESVHRLDMDTSGIMIYARNETAAADLRRQFEEHTVQKTYLARLSSPDNHIESSSELADRAKGRIRLPLSADYDERPRQKADMSQGKESLTEYEVVRTYEDGRTDILFHPITGRTHQLRVHSAHIHGLARPIVGDLLYGGEPHKRLCLHAMEITFRHPGSGEEMTFSEHISF